MADKEMKIDGEAVELTPEETETVDGGTDTRLKVVICKNCGYRYRYERRTCPKCGSRERKL